MPDHVAYVGVSSASNDLTSSSGAVNSAVCNFPTGTTEGDILIAHVLEWTLSAAFPATPAGWTALHQTMQPADGDGDFRGSVFYHVATAGESDATTVTFNDGSHGFHMNLHVQLIGFRPAANGTYSITNESSYFGTVGANDEPYTLTNGAGLGDSNTDHRLVQWLGGAENHAGSAHTPTLTESPSGATLTLDDHYMATSQEGTNHYTLFSDILHKVLDGVLEDVEYDDGGDSHWMYKLSVGTEIAWSQTGPDPVEVPAAVPIEIPLRMRTHHLPYDTNKGVIRAR